MAALAAGAQFNLDQCYINCIGFTGDHPDGIQAFAGIGGPMKGNLKVTNTFFRSYGTNESIAVYGSSAVSSDALFYSDGSSGNVTFNNVVVASGDRGVTIDADTSGLTIHVNFNNVYFVPTAADSFAGWVYRIEVRGTGGTLVIDNWSNVFMATIVNGVIIPGVAIPSPPGQYP